MAMRPRGGGRTNPPRGPARPRTGGVWPVYEDFRPASEWQQGDEFHTLNVFLPGFTKEQIRVSTEDKKIIRVRGERLVAGNKWSRFQEDFQVPENGEINAVRAKYQGGTLSITVPKKKVDKQPKETPSTPKAADVEKQTASQKGKDKISGEGTSQTRKDHSRATDGSKSAERERLEAKRTSDEQIMDHPLRDIGIEAEKIAASVGLKGKRISEKTDEAHKTRDDVKNKILDKFKGLPDASAAAEKMKSHLEGRAEGDKGSNSKQTIRSRGDDREAASTMQRLNKKMKGLAELNEERQLLVNMGVAVLVIMGLSAYVTYQFMTRQEKN